MVWYCSYICSTFTITSGVCDFMGQFWGCPPQLDLRSVTHVRVKHLHQMSLQHISECWICESLDHKQWTFGHVDIKNILLLLRLTPWRDSASDALDLLKPLKRLHYFISHNKVIIVHIDRYQVVIWCVSTTLGWTRLSRWAVLWWPWRVVRHCLW